MLAVPSFLKHLLQWTQCTSIVTGIFATNNTRLVAQVQSQLKLKHPVPNSTFKPDWDIVQAIVKAYQSTTIDATFVHVKGHQDQKVPFYKLPLLAQLNVEADRHAGTYPAEFGEY
jgi:hypothetical protein